MQYLTKNELETADEKALPILKGNGQSAEDAYILHDINQFLAPSLEKMIVDITLKNNGLNHWLMEKQTLRIINERYMDVLDIIVINNGNADSYKFYFDLTDIM